MLEWREYLVLTVGIAVAIVATTAALAPAITPSVYTPNGKKKELNPSNSHRYWDIFKVHQLSKFLNQIRICQLTQGMKENGINKETNDCIITMRTALGHGQFLIQRSQASSLKRRISSNISVGHLN